jgi:hypothetical protein
MIQVTLKMIMIMKKRKMMSLKGMKKVRGKRLRKLGISILPGRSQIKRISRLGVLRKNLGWLLMLKLMTMMEVSIMRLINRIGGV